MNNAFHNVILSHFQNIPLRNQDIRFIDRLKARLIHPLGINLLCIL